MGAFFSCISFMANDLCLLLWLEPQFLFWPPLIPSDSTKASYSCRQTTTIYYVENNPTSHRKPAAAADNDYDDDHLYRSFCG